MITDLGTILSQDQLQATKSLLLAHRDCWTHFSEYPVDNNDSTSPMYMFGSPAHAVGAGLELYKTLRSRTDQILANCQVLQATKARLSQHFNLPIEQLPDTSLPGFHIFNSTDGKDRQLNVTGYHQDNYFAPIKQPIKYSSMYSLLVAIEMPKAGGGLDYLDRRDEPQTYKWEPGHLYLFKSAVQHKMSKVVLEDDNDYRITFHGQLIVEVDKIVYFW